MSAPLIADGSLGVSVAAAIALGAAFGFALERAGLGSARKLIGQFYGRDMAVMKVMFARPFLTDPARKELRQSMVQALIDNDWAGTAQELTRYLELEPKNEEPMVWFRLGNALTQAKEHQRAIPALENFLKSTGGSKTAQYAGYLLGTDYEETGNADKAQKTYERALNLFPSSEFSSMIRGRLKRLSGKQAAAQPAQPAQAAAPSAQAANPKQ